MGAIRRAKTGAMDGSGAAPANAGAREEMDAAPRQQGFQDSEGPRGSGPRRAPRAPGRRLPPALAAHHNRPTRIKVPPPKPSQSNKKYHDLVIRPTPHFRYL